MTILTTTHGSPIATITGICEQFSICEQTAARIIREMEKQDDRYGNPTIGKGKLKRINVLAFYDYWKNRDELKDKNMRKHVEPYNPQRTAWELGFYGEGE